MEKNIKKQICQIFCVTLLVLSAGCSLEKRKDKKQASVYGTKEYVDSFVSVIKPRWFKSVKRFKKTDAEGNTLAHRFFDVNPSIDPKEKTLNVIIATPQNSAFEKSLDLSSGQLYVSQKYCPQEDIKEKYNGKIHKPPFSIGVVPRYLDQLGKPQKIMVFGGENYFNKYYNSHFFDVRVIGGYIEQTCPVGACLDNSLWVSRLVLIAVQNESKKFAEVKNIMDLKEEVDWAYVKAFVENGFGKNKTTNYVYQGYRMGAVVSSGQALEFMNKNSIYFTIDKMKKMRKSCYKLYDYLWKDLSFVKKEEKQYLPVKNEKRFQKKTKKKKSTASFSRRFIGNFKKFHKELKTCSQFVYPTNINDNPHRHWFFAYLLGFHQLHDLGFSFDCAINTWRSNPVIGKNKRLLSINEELKGCSTFNIDRAMPISVKMFKNLYAKGKKSFRYIDYDSGIEGTHNKLFSWVPLSGKKLSCENKEDSLYIENKDFFPMEVKWQKRAVQKKKNKELGEIIY